jgi:hypothetical protein
MLVPGKLYSYCGASKIPIWDGDLLEERKYNNCIGQVVPNDILMILDVFHMTWKRMSTVTQIKFLNSNGIVGVVCVFSNVADSNFKQL